MTAKLFNYQDHDIVKNSSRFQAVSEALLFMFESANLRLYT